VTQPSAPMSLFQPLVVVPDCRPAHNYGELRLLVEVLDDAIGVIVGRRRRAGPAEVEAARRWVLKGRSRSTTAARGSDGTPSM
jgi:hypothetical protein